MSAIPTVQKPRISASQFEAWRNSVSEQRRAADAFQNLAANLGFQSSNLLEATNYPLTRLSFNYILLMSMYRSHWIVRKIVDAPAEDMTKNWVSLNSDLDPEQLGRFDKVQRDTGTINQVLTTLKWARLFGGAAAIIMIKGDENRLDKPLKLDDVEPDSYRGLIPLDRWSGISPGAELCADIDRPLDFGLPESYQVTLKTGKTFKIHASRVLRFIGRDVPSWEKEVEQQWGVSEIEIIFDELRKRDNTSWNIASLVFRANIIGIRQDNLAQILSGVNANPQAARNFYSTLSAQASLMSNQGLMVLPKEGGLETHTYAFGGVGLMYQQFKEDMAGAAEIPYSRIFGRPPGGLATTNEGDEHVYYERIRARQLRDLDPQMMKLFPVIAMSTWGSVPDDFDWNWRPVATLSSTEQANIGVARTGAVMEVLNAGVISPRVALRELQQMSEETELWTNVTDEDVMAADDRTISPVEGMEMQQEQAEESAAQEAETKGKEAENPAPVLKVEAKPEKKKAKDAALEARNWEIAGLRVNIENLRGSLRQGKSKDGTPWSVKLTAPYGYIIGTEGVDGDAVDCFVGPVLNAATAYVIHTRNVETDEYDEDKVMLSFSSAAEALDTFAENYTGGMLHFDSMDKIPVRALKDKLKTLRGRKLVS